MGDIAKYLITLGSSVKQALKQLNQGLGDKPTLFVVNTQQELQGTLTDGDIRRGLVEGLKLEDPVEDFMYRDCKYIQESPNIPDLEAYKVTGIHIIPLVDASKRILKLYDLLTQEAVLPLEAVVMCGGEGQRLRPLTLTTPKPLLKIGDKPILQHNIDRLARFGIQQVYLTIRYLGSQIQQFYEHNEAPLQVTCVRESEPLGTIGAVKLINDIKTDHVLVMNADLLTNIDLGEFYQHFLSKEADMAVATVPYTVKVPYAVLETDDGEILSFQEKPTYTYYSNAGIYLIKKEYLKIIPDHQFYDATDFMKTLIEMGRKLVYFPILGYWQDIGKMDDFEKAQQDIKRIKL